MKQRQIIIVGSVLLIFALGFLIMKLLAAQKPDKTPVTEKPTERFVNAEKIEYKTIRSSVSATGRLSSASEVSIVAQASGVIIEHNVRLKNGESFSKGQLLFEIDKEQQSYALKAQKSNFLKALVSVMPDIKIDYNDNYNDFDTFLKNVNLNKSLPPLPDISNEKLKIFLASKGVLSAYYTLKQQEEALSRHLVYAPFNGSYKQVTSEAGTYTNIGGRIATIIKTDELELEVSVDNSNSKWLKVGQNVDVYSSSRDLQWKGKIARISNFVDAQTQSRTIWLTIANKKGQQLLSGEYLMAEFGGITINNSFEIPRNAVFNSNEVYLVVDGKLKTTTINILKVNSKTLLFNGVAEGSYIVTEPLINVQENTPVSILKN